VTSTTTQIQSRRESDGSHQSLTATNAKTWPPENKSGVGERWAVNIRACRTSRSGRKAARDLARATRRWADLRRGAGRVRNGARNAMNQWWWEVLCVPAGMGGPRAGRACASSAPPRARAARRSRNPSPASAAPRRRYSVRSDWLCWWRWMVRVAHCDGGQMRVRSGRTFYTGGDPYLQPLAHANRAMRRICEALPRLRAPSPSSCPVISRLPELCDAEEIGPTGFFVLWQVVEWALGAPGPLVRWARPLVVICPQLGKRNFPLKSSEANQQVDLYKPWWILLNSTFLHCS
jgi:hypothetical protein